MYVNVERHLFLSWHLGRVSVDTRSSQWRLAMLADSYVTESALPELGPAATTASLYINHFGRWSSRPSTTYYLRSHPAPAASFASAQHTYQPVHLHPLLGFAYVRPVCQPVLLTDVRIDNLCPLIMTVRSRARRYLTVRVIAISSSILCPLTNRDQSSKISFELREFQAKSRAESWQLEVFPNAFVGQEWFMRQNFEILHPLENYWI